MKSCQPKVVLVTTGQPALNPRLVKEADALCEAGYKVTVIFAYWNAWGDEFTKQLLVKKKWTAVCAGGHPIEQPFTYLLSQVIFKLSKWFLTSFKFDLFRGGAIARCTPFLTRCTKRYKADLYIGHYIGALPAIVKAAKKHNAKCGFDAEDFHRQEATDDITTYNYKIVKYVEDKYYLSLDYLSASSPQIAAAYQQLYPAKKPVILLNVFPRIYGLPKRSVNNGPIKLFWFSQTTGTNRGIEDVIKALNNLLKSNFELHLLGHASTDTKKDFLNLSNKHTPIYFHDPIPSDEVINFCSQFDVGLALEPGFSTNNKLALSNKLFTYLQAGIAIMVSDTIAQKYFIDKYPAIGKSYPIKQIEMLTSILSNWEANRPALYDACEASAKLGAEELNWETESIKFLALVADTLSKIE